MRNLTGSSRKDETGIEGKVGEKDGIGQELGS